MYNYSYALLFLAWFQCHTAATRFATICLGYRNNHNPRVALADMDKSGKYPSGLMAKLRRREAAHQNCLEMFGIFVAAVVAGNTAGLSARWMNSFSLAYLLLRCAYIFLYIKVTSDPTSFLRTAVWTMMNVLILVTLLRTGEALNGGVGLLG